MSVQDCIFVMQNKNTSISNTSACKNNTKEWINLDDIKSPAI